MEEPAADPNAAEVNGMAMLALFLAIIWLFGIGAVAGIVLGWRALIEIRDSEPPEEGRSLAIAAIPPASSACSASAC